MLLWTFPQGLNVVLCYINERCLRMLPMQIAVSLCLSEESELLGTRSLCVNASWAKLIEPKLLTSRCILPPHSVIVALARFAVTQMACRRGSFYYPPSKHPPCMVLLKHAALILLYSQPPHLRQGVPQNYP